MKDFVQDVKHFEQNNTIIFRGIYWAFCKVIPGGWNLLTRRTKKIQAYLGIKTKKENEMQTVYIPNLPTRWDEATGTRVPSIDLNPAGQFGKLQTLTEGPIPEPEFEDARITIREALMDAAEGDFILTVGDVVLTALAIHYQLADYGCARVLRWDRKRHSYDIMEVTL